MVKIEFSMILKLITSVENVLIFIFEFILTFSMAMFTVFIQSTLQTCFHLSTRASSATMLFSLLISTLLLISIPFISKVIHERLQIIVVSLLHCMLSLIIAMAWLYPGKEKCFIIIATGVYHYSFTKSILMVNTVSVLGQTLSNELKATGQSILFGTYLLANIFGHLFGGMVANYIGIICLIVGALTLFVCFIYIMHIYINDSLIVVK